MVFMLPKTFNLSRVSAFTQTNASSLLCATHVAGSQNSNKPVGLWIQEHGSHCSATAGNNSAHLSSHLFY